MEEEYCPNEDVVGFVSEVLRGMNLQKRVENPLFVLTQGRVKTYDEAMEQVRKGTPFGRALYNLAEDTLRGSSSEQTIH